MTPGAVILLWAPPAITSVIGALAARELWRPPPGAEPSRRAARGATVMVALAAIALAACVPHFVRSTPETRAQNLEDYQLGWAIVFFVPAQLALLALALACRTLATPPAARNEYQRGMLSLWSFLAFGIGGCYGVLLTMQRCAQSR